MYKRVVFGAVGNDRVEAMQDINGREFIVLTLLAVGVLGIGLYPLPLTQVMHASVDNLLVQMSHSKLAP